jgi:hypothetical protein
MPREVRIVDWGWKLNFGAIRTNGGELNAEQKSLELIMLIGLHIFGSNGSSARKKAKLME